MILGGWKHSGKRNEESGRVIFEEHFLCMYCRHDDGRYFVEMTIKDAKLNILGKSWENTGKRLNFFYLMKHLYENFIKYNQLGHSEEISEKEFQFFLLLASSWNFQTRET